jgi:hypothetical protein
MKTKIFFLVSVVLLFPLFVFAQSLSFQILDSVSLESIFETQVFYINHQKGFGIPEISYRFDGRGQYLWLFDGKKIIKYDFGEKKIIKSTSITCYSNSEFLRIVTSDSLIAVLEVVNQYNSKKEELTSMHRFRFFDFELNELREKHIEFSCNHYLEMPWESSAYNFEYFFETDTTLTFVTAANKSRIISKKSLKKVFISGERYSYSAKKYFSFEKQNETFFLEFDNKKYLFDNKNRFVYLGFLPNNETYVSIMGSIRNQEFKFYDLKKGLSTGIFSVDNFVLPRAFQERESILSSFKTNSGIFLYNNRPFKRKEDSHNFIYKFELPTK